MDTGVPIIQGLHIHLTRYALGFLAIITYVADRNLCALEHEPSFERWSDIALLAPITIFILIFGL